MIKALLDNALALNSFQDAVKVVGTLREYNDCFYCLAYRTQLMDHAKGCCTICPLHKYGEKVIGREISYNGCYKIPPYREMVKLAWDFCSEPNEIIAKSLINAIQGSIDLLKFNEKDA